MRSSFCSVMLGFVTIVGLSGCGLAGGTDSVRFDAASKKSANESIDKMCEGMSAVEKKAFFDRAMAVCFHMNREKQTVVTSETFWKGLHGMSKAEIEAKS